MSETDTKVSGGLFPVWLVWAVLAGASVTGFALAEGASTAPFAANAAVLLAAAKIHLIFGQYMEVRWKHQPLRSLLSVWLAIVTLILLAGYWSS
ncbi:MAG: cytochrome C oxidase subunit IV family protein [Pseudomonadota bacterium]